MAAEAEEGALAECPVCGLWSEGGAEFEAHVNGHFAETPQKQQHRQHRRPPAAAPMAVDDDDANGTPITCALCGARVPLTELDSHEAAHALDAAHAREDAAQAQARRAAEAAQFAALQRQYGFVDATATAAPRAPPRPREGECYACGERGHWHADCPRAGVPPKEHRISAQPRLPVEPAALAAAQRREPSDLAAADVVPLLKAALAAELKAHTTIYLCSYAAHLCRARLDSGWGCGYRNLQMLASHLLARRPDLRPALFGGSGWLPDIPSLQAWLECAWARGFDPPGAKQLGGAVQGTPKWIGTPEVAAVLRSFGVDARIVDFCGAGGGLATNAAGATVHRNVACDGCGAAPIVGVRHKSTVRADYDLCGRCARAPAAAAAAPFITLGFDAKGSGGGSGSGGGGSSGGGDNALRRQALPPPGSSDRADGGGDGDDDDASPPPPPPPAAAAAAAAAGRGKAAGSAAAAGAEAGNGALVKWVWEYFSRAPPAGSGGSGSSGRSSGSAAAGGSTSAGVGADAGATTAGQQQQQHQQQPLRSAFDVLRASPIVVTGRGPLYLQHEGHSRTVVGVEQCRRPAGAPASAPPTYRLLILDPSDDASPLRAALAGAGGAGGRGGTWQRRVKRGARTFTRAEYQVLYVKDADGGGPAAPGSAEYEAAKTIRADDRIWS